METITIAIIIIALTVILFSSFSYSYVSPDKNADVPIDMLNSTGKPRAGIIIQQQQHNPIIQPTTSSIGKVNPNAPTYALFNLPEKDEYMTADLRNQIDTLRTQYYYDNCQFVNKDMNIKDKFISNKDKFTDLCSLPDEARISFVNYQLPLMTPL